MTTTNRFRTRFLGSTVLMGAATALVLSGCSGGGSSPATSTEAGSSTSVQVDAAAAALLPAKYKESGINVAADMPNPPMEMLDENQNPTGFDYDLAQALGAKLGVKFTFVQQTFDTAVPSLQAGKHDIIMAGMNDTVERQKVLDFVDYFHAGFVIVVQKGNPENITRILDLCGKNVAVQKSTVQGELLEGYADKCKAAGAGPINLVQLPTELDAQTAVRSNKAVADVVDASVGTYAAETAGDGQIFELVKDVEHPGGYNPVYTGIGLLKGNDDLAKALNMALQSVMDDGTYAKLLDKYKLSDFAIDKAGINRASE
jgi:polar amino acid transport system substrate-binding protein